MESRAEEAFTMHGERATRACAQRHALVVDDEAGLLEIISVNLEAAGFRVTAATNGMQAFRCFEESCPDVIILDLSLPHVSGFRLARLFKRYAPSIPLVVETALDFAEAEELASLGVEGFFTKPLDLERLVRTVRWLTNGRVGIYN